jgi:outer membrane protein OmpA-like peptidoglycan-associated protein
MAKKMLVLTLMMLLAGAVSAQQTQTGLQQHAATEVLGAKKAVHGLTYADVYCAGYIASPSPAPMGHVAGGWYTPHQQEFGTNDWVYLKGGGFELGKTYEVVRPARDQNHMRHFSGQMMQIGSAGQPVFEVGQVKVTELRGNIAIAQVQFSCDGMFAGDSVVAMPDRPLPLYHGPMTFERFAPENGKMTGRIILTKDFDMLIGTRSKVYLNIGADKGVKQGDWFRITRDYTATRKDEVDRISWGPRDLVDDSQAQPKRLPMNELHTLPRRSLGELVITQVEAKSATGVVTFALEEMFVGDMVEMIDVPPPVAEAAATYAPPAIQCAASPASVRVGDNSTISCEASSPDNRPLTIAFASDRGSLTPRESMATLSTSNAGAGPITVNATVTDDRNLSASTSVVVNVEAAPAAPEPSLAGEAMFKTNSAYVDNRAKAMLDGIALRMNQERDAKAVIVGFAGPGEAQSLALRRANNVKTYLTKTKGIDAARIETRAGSGAAKKAEVWIVPAGATMP